MTKEYKIYRGIVDAKEILQDLYSEDITYSIDEFLKKAIQLSSNGSIYKKIGMLTVLSVSAIDMYWDDDGPYDWVSFVNLPETSFCISKYKEIEKRYKKKRPIFTFVERYSRARLGYRTIEYNKICAWRKKKP